MLFPQWMCLPLNGNDARQITGITLALQPEKYVRRPQTQCRRGL